MCMDDTNIRLFQQAVGLSNINVLMLCKDLSNLSLIDRRFRQMLYQNYDYSVNFDLFLEKIRPGMIIPIEDEFRFSYLLLRLPEECISQDEIGLLSIGPFSSRQNTVTDLMDILQKNEISAALLSEVTVFYDSIPVVENTVALECLVQCLASGLFHQEFHVIRLPEYDTVLLGNTGQLRNVTEDPAIALASIEERYREENKLLEAVKAGDYDRARAQYIKFITYQIQPRADNPVRNQQHMAVILNTLFRKTVEQGGVHPLYIDDISTKFAVMINRVDTFPDIRLLVNEMIHKYCLLVKNYSMKGYSSVTKEIVSYIDFHYMEDLNLNFFADMCSVTRNYLSNLFRKETGVTLTDYIHQVRMRKAITLVNSTNMPVASIASACGYNDINYFIRIFKRTYGLSPKQYRKSIIHP